MFWTLIFRILKKKVGRRLRIKDKALLKRIRKKLIVAKREGRSIAAMNSILKEDPTGKNEILLVLGAILTVTIVGILAGPSNDNSFVW